MSNYAFEVSMGFSPKRLRGLRVVFVSWSLTLNYLVIQLKKNMLH